MELQGGKATMLLHKSVVGGALSSVQTESLSTSTFTYWSKVVKVLERIDSLTFLEVWCWIAGKSAVDLALGMQGRPPGYCSSWERMMRLLGSLLLSSSLGGTTTPPCRTERTPTLCVLGGDDSGTGAAWAAARLGVPTVLVLTVRARLASTACCVLWALVGVLLVHLQ